MVILATFNLSSAKAKNEFVNVQILSFGKELIFYISVFILFSEFTVANYYGNHMVLQKAPKRSLIWGYANGPDIAVNVTLTGFSTSTTYSQYDSTIKKFVWRTLLPAVTGRLFLIMICE